MAAIDARKLMLIERLVSLNDDLILSKLEAFFSENFAMNDWWDELTDTQTRKIENASLEAKQGLGKPFSEILKKYS